MTEGLDLYDDVLTTSGPVEDEALQSHVCIRDFEKFTTLAPVVQKVDNTTHRKNHYPVDNC